MKEEMGPLEQQKRVEVWPPEKIIFISGGPYKVRKKEWETIKKDLYFQGATKPHMRGGMQNS